jgi:hypothetical protein
LRLTCGDGRANLDLVAYLPVDLDHHRDRRLPQKLRLRDRPRLSVDVAVRMSDQPRLGRKMRHHRGEEAQQQIDRLVHGPLIGPPVHVVVDGVGELHTCGDGGVEREALHVTSHPRNTPVHDAVQVVGTALSICARRIV